MNHFTGLSFIICHRDNEDISSTLNSIHNSYLMMAPEDRCYEIHTVRGNHPSLQRNVTADEVQFSHIYFLDNDSLLHPEGLKYVISKLKSSPVSSQEFSQGETRIMGGPAVLPPQANYFEICVDGLLTSYPVVGRRAARYIRRGDSRETDGTELILCNMVVDKKTFLDSGRFDYRLYPNEENEFMNRIHKSLGGIVYAPDMAIQRHQRKNYPDYIKQMMNYGRGKAEEIKVSLSSSQLRYLRLFIFFTFVFLFILLFSGTVLFLQSNLGMNFSFLPFSISFKVWLPHVFVGYGGYIFWTTSKASVRKKRFLFHFPLLLLLGHFFYGLYCIVYLFRKKYFYEKKALWFQVDISELLIP